MTPDSIVEEIRSAREDFHRLVDGATTAELRQRSNGTKWTNDQLLFHMLFGYLVVRNLIWLVRGFSMLPPAYSRRFAHALNAASRPFHVVNYLGSLGGARVLGHGGMERVMDRVTTSLTRILEHSTEKQLARGMHFPVGWDPYFRDYMTVQDVLHYATQHYQHHRRQLTLSHAHHH
jgi:DinB superfamily